MSFRQSVLVVLTLVAGLVGCSICQDCQDYTGPVMESPNYPDYYDSARSGSGIGVVPQGEPTPAQPEPQYVMPEESSARGSGPTQVR